MSKHLLLPLLFIAAALFGQCWGAPSSNKVLILGPTISTGLPVPGGSYEVAAVMAAGLVPEVVSAATWSGMTAAQFGTYRGIVLGDATCTSLGAYTAAINNANVWLPQVTGGVIVMGTDPVYHTRFTNSAINQWNINAIDFAVADPGKVGAYLCLSCAYDSVAPFTPIPMLAPLGVFTARGVNCFNNAHIVAVHAALTGLTDAILSGWGCSVHNAFDSYPATFLPLAIARSIGGSGTLTFADGSSGVPYILARGVVPVLCGDGILQSPEQCDAGANNGVLGMPCSSSCRLHWCGDGALDAGEQCDVGAGNGTPGSSCDTNCMVTGPSCIPGCGSHGNCTFMTDGLHTHCVCAPGWSGPDCTCVVPSYLLKTDKPPVLDLSRSGFLSKDQLSLTVNVSAKYYNTQIMFKNELNESCNFPATTSVNFWSSQYFGPDSCLWMLKGVIPWGIAWRQCLFRRREDDNYITFTGEMDISFLEDIPDIRGVDLIREHLHALPFNVVFPKYVEVSHDPTSVQVHSPYDIRAGIVAQKFITTDPPVGVGSVRLYTSVQWPYALQPTLSSSSDNALLPITVSGPEVVAGGLCPNDGTSACQQWFNFVILPEAGACTLNGHYTFNFMVGCHPSVPMGTGPGACPLSAPVPSSIEYELQSSYFCEQVVANVDLSATLVPYGTPTYTTPKYDFVLGATGYWLVHTASTQVSITHTYISQIIAEAPNGTEITLYDTALGGHTPAGNWVSLVVTNNSPVHGTQANDATFSVLYVPSFFDIDEDSSAQWGFYVTANTVFYNTGTAALHGVTFMQKLKAKTDGSTLGARAAGQKTKTDGSTLAAAGQKTKTDGSTLAAAGQKTKTDGSTLGARAAGQKSLIDFVTSAYSNDGLDDSHAGRSLNAHQNVILLAGKEEDQATSAAATESTPAKVLVGLAIALVAAFTQSQ